MTAILTEITDSDDDGDGVGWRNRLFKYREIKEGKKKSPIIESWPFDRWVKMANFLQHTLYADRDIQINESEYFFRKGAQKKEASRENKCTGATNNAVSVNKWPKEVSKWTR